MDNKPYELPYETKNGELVKVGAMNFKQWFEDEGYKLMESMGHIYDREPQDLMQHAWQEGIEAGRVIEREQIIAEIREMGRDNAQIRIRCNLIADHLEAE